VLPVVTAICYSNIPVTGQSVFHAFLPTSKIDKYNKKYGKKKMPMKFITNPAIWYKNLEHAHSIIGEKLFTPHPY